MGFHELKLRLKRWYFRTKVRLTLRWRYKHVNECQLDTSSYFHITDRDLVLKIKEFNLKKQPIWFTKLCNELKASPKEIMRHLYDAEEWGIVEGEYESINNKSVGYCYFVTDFGDIFLNAKRSKK